MVISVRDSLFTGQVVLNCIPKVIRHKPVGEPEREDFRQHFCVVLTWIPALMDLKAGLWSEGISQINLCCLWPEGFVTAVEMKIKQC